MAESGSPLRAHSPDPPDRGLWSSAQEEDAWKLKKERQYFYSIIISALLNSCFLIILVISIAAAVQSLSCVQLFVTPRDHSMPGSSVFCCPSEFAQTHWVCTLSQWWNQTISSSVAPFSSCLQSFPASGSFSNELVLRIKWPKYWSFSFSHQSFHLVNTG